ncbi:nuclear transport factor 2 family protein [Novosphingobium terrae]|uniref:nuclear transport factor 2 family protein n=1 Tax=Novosphingobium terrae TaxID=2726189 RepID=UPI00197EAA0F|nr:nuclear transport factor 2 family protein [Novosphingobium terrae]
MSDGRLEGVLQAEKDRIAALLSKNVGGVKALLDESLVHVHTTGRLEDYYSYLAGVSGNLEFLEISRGDLTVRFFGDAAVMTGPLDQRIRILANGGEMDLTSFATQVWVQAGTGWKLASFHACRRD